MKCESTNFAFPMQADVYYPIVEQGTYGNIKKQWILDRTIACSFSTGGSAFKEEVSTNVNITKDQLLVGRTQSDVRISERESRNSITNIILTNIRDSSGNILYSETDGVRSGKGTIYEVATQEPFIGPFGNVEYHKLVIRRSENQASDI
jgi:hypothetical protein